MDIVEQLVNIYNTQHHHDTALTDLEARRYYSSMVAGNRVHVYLQGNEVIGFIESWRLDYEQLGRVVCWHEFNALEEDVQVGDVVWVSDIWVREDCRDGNVNRILINMFLDNNKDAEYGVSRRVKSRCKYIRVYDKKSVYKHKEMGNGR